MVSILNYEKSQISGVDVPLLKLILDRRTKIVVENHTSCCSRVGTGFHQNRVLDALDVVAFRAGLLLLQKPPLKGLPAFCESATGMIDHPLV